MPSIFILGVTGYIGGSVFAVLKEVYPDYEFVALIRSSTVAEAISKTGVRTIIGSFDDHDKIAQAASEVDVVMNIADCDNIALTENLLRGIKERWSATGKVGTLIHTSGAAIFLDSSTEGKFNKDGKVWTDSEEDIKLLTPSMLHGQVDVPILKAGTEGFVNTYIICPSGVYGPAIGDGADLRTSIFFKLIVGEIQRSRAPIVVGEGSNVFGLIHINDLMHVYTNVFDLALKTLNTRSEASPYSRYFIANVSDVPMWQIKSSVAEDLKRRGLIENAEVASAAYDASDVFAGLLSRNSVCVARRAKEMFGWEPKERTFEDFVAGHVDICLSGQSK